MLKNLNPKSLYRFLKKSRDYYFTGKSFLTHPRYLETQRKIQAEIRKSPSRTEVLNYLISYLDREISYLEIGVRNPNDNYNHIDTSLKYSVDPGIEFEENPVDFKLTSDVFFEKLRNNTVLSSQIKFDLIFIDGLHLAEQVDRDIENSLAFIKDDGFIVLHDCNPPTEWHTRNDYNYEFTPAELSWNGTTWKAFLKWRYNTNIQSCCIDTDWGLGILSKKQPIGHSIKSTNPFYEIDDFLRNKKTLLNLLTYREFKVLMEG